MDEEWRTISGYEDLYEVSDQGQVRGTKGGRIHVLNSHPNEHGYLCVRLYRDGHPTNKRVHRLVLESFVGPCPEGMECLHEDDVRSNNTLSNLRWGTHQENVEARIRSGNKVCARKHPYAPWNLGTGTKRCAACELARRAKGRAKARGLLPFDMQAKSDWYLEKLRAEAFEGAQFRRPRDSTAANAKGAVGVELRDVFPALEAYAKSQNLSRAEAVRSLLRDALCCANVD